MCIRRVFARRIVCGVEVVAKNRHGYAVLLPCAEEGARERGKSLLIRFNEEERSGIMLLRENRTLPTQNVLRGSLPPEKKS